jgi:pilus assembly protein Flp/PilA
MIDFLNLFSRFVSNDEGTTAIEYVLIASLVSISIIGGATAIGVKLDGVFTAFSAAIP